MDNKDFLRIKQLSGLNEDVNDIKIAVIMKLVYILLTNIYIIVIKSIYLTNQKCQRITIRIIMLSRNQ
jgi:hypothetical protein